MTHTPFLTAALVALTMTAATPMAFAQETAPATGITAENVSDAQVEAFVTVAIALEALRSEYSSKIGNAETEDTQNELRAEADRVAIQLVEKARGIGPDEYLQISKLAQSDEALSKRISAQVDVMRAKKAEFEEQQAEAKKARDKQRAEEAQKAAEDTAKDTATSE